MSLLSALSSPVTGPIASVLAVALGLAFAYEKLTVVTLRTELASSQRSIGQLQGAIVNQNVQVLTWQAQSEAAAKRAQTAVVASRKAHAADQPKVAALLAKPAVADPALACKAADENIREFFSK